MSSLTPEERQIIKKACQDLENKIQNLEDKRERIKASLRQASSSLTVASAVGIGCLLVSPENMSSGMAFGAAVGYSAAIYKENQKSDS